MKTYNSVHLEGFVETCRIAGELSGKTVSKLSVITLHPKAVPDEGPAQGVSERYEKMRHMVRVVATGQLADEMRRLSRSLGTESDLEGLFPCRLDGQIASQGTDNFIDVRDGGFALVKSIATENNDTARVLGEVKSVSYTDRSAKLLVSAGDSLIHVVALRSESLAAWNSVAEGRVVKGDMVSLSGPVHSMEFTDGQRTVCAALVSPRQFEKLEMKKSKDLRGPSL